MVKVMSTVDPTAHHFRGIGTAEAPPVTRPKKIETAKPPRGPRRGRRIGAVVVGAVLTAGSALGLAARGSGNTEVEAGARPTTTSLEGSSSTTLNTAPSPLGNSAEAIKLQSEIAAASNEYGFPMQPVSTKHKDPVLIYQSLMHNMNCFMNTGSDECRKAVFGDPIHEDNALHTSVVNNVESGEYGPNGVFLWHAAVDPDGPEVSSRWLNDEYLEVQVDSAYYTASRAEGDLGDYYQETPSISNEHHRIEAQLQSDGSYNLTGFWSTARYS